ncbi:MAG: deoxyribodipyrimidine photolyase [Planctomycetes bacterium]|nr:deoxyribodipyrimidine photolyase [Planctomycetota bacterium]
MAPPAVPASRITVRNAAPPAADGDYVLYWCTANRRASWNFALDRAIEWAMQLRRPLLVLEALRADYPWASARLHRFVLQGMAANRAAFAGKPVLYRPYVEPRAGAGKGLLAALARRACVVVGDDWPCFFLPAMTAAAARAIHVRFELVDGNGMVPLSASSAAFPTAHLFRRFWQKELAREFPAFPRPDPWKGVTLPLAGPLPATVNSRWPEADESLLTAQPGALAAFRFRHAVAPAPFAGGAPAARAALLEFVRQRLPRYADERSDPDHDAVSGLSPWLHFGHLSAHEVFAEVARREGWKRGDLGAPNGGSKEGFWQMSAAAEAFLDQLVGWRELGFHFCRHRPDYADFESLPDWAKATLRAHALDPRLHTYSLEQFAAARTHDPVWNAAQRELVATGRMHNYLRMLWGKKIVEWTQSPQQAAAFMIELNNRYAVDGRDPNSYSGIFWTLGRFDRPWAPERDVFGVIRWMSSANTLKKLRMKAYLARWGGDEGPGKGPFVRD